MRHRSTVAGENPILMRARANEALLAGEKTQARKIVKEAISDGEVAHSVCRDGDGTWIAWFGDGFSSPEAARENTLLAYPEGGGFACPYGEPDDLLYVRETYTYVTDEFGASLGVAYRADGTIRWLYDPALRKLMDRVQIYRYDRPDVWRWRPPYTLPKELSRTWLRITDLRVEQIQDIGHGDMLRMGYVPDHNKLALLPEDRKRFARLWDEEYSYRKDKPVRWRDDPQVWVIDYEVLSTDGRP